MNQADAMRWLAAWRTRSILYCILGASGGLIFSIVLLAGAWTFFVVVFNQLQLVDGVLCLKSDPPGLALEGRLRKEMEAGAGKGTGR